MHICDQLLSFQGECYNCVFISDTEGNVYCLDLWMGLGLIFRWLHKVLLSFACLHVEATWYISDLPKETEILRCGVILTASYKKSRCTDSCMVYSMGSGALPLVASGAPPVSLLPLTIKSQLHEDWKTAFICLIATMRWWGLCSMWSMWISSKNVYLIASHYILGVILVAVSRPNSNTIDVRMWNQQIAHLISSGKCVGASKARKQWPF